MSESKTKGSRRRKQSKKFEMKKSEERKEEILFFNFVRFFFPLETHQIEIIVAYRYPHHLLTVLFPFSLMLIANRIVLSLALFVACQCKCSAHNFHCYASLVVAQFILYFSFIRFIYLFVTIKRNRCCHLRTKANENKSKAAKQNNYFTLSSGKARNERQKKCRRK